MTNAGKSFSSFSESAFQFGHQVALVPHSTSAFCKSLTCCDGMNASFFGEDVGDRCDGDRCE